MGRTLAIGDIHGDLDALERLLINAPRLGADDTIVFLGDYLDRGPHSAQVVARVRALAASGPAKVVALRGKHEDAWLKVIDQGWFEFIIVRGNGCLDTLRSFQGREPKVATEGEGKGEGEASLARDTPDSEDFAAMERGAFFPPDVVAWMRELPYFYEDEHAIYVHAGIKRQGEGFPHPSQTTPPSALLWLRDRDFFVNYRGKLVVFGHTVTKSLPPELSTFTPEDPADLWAGPACAGLDTGCGKGGFLTGLLLPERLVYESR
jgi:serine/threonine protein phosphatase 1